MVMLHGTKSGVAGRCGGTASAAPRTEAPPLAEAAYPGYVDPRPVAVITGATGGMGKPIARTLGHRYQLALTDVGAGALAKFAEELRAEAYAVPVCMAMDISKPDQVAALASAVKQAGRLGAVVHTAALWGAMADWRRVTEVNLVGSQLLLDAMLALAEPGTAVVSIASGAGHFMAPNPALNAVIDNPLAPDFLDRLEPFINELSGPGRAPSSTAYSVSKLAMIRQAERQVGDWAAKGARIVTISPGAIFTGSAVAEELDNPRAAEVHRLVPLGRWGTPMDIARVTEFLCSDAASFISGCDLRVDGGLIPFVKAKSGG